MPPSVAESATCRERPNHLYKKVHLVSPNTLKALGRQLTSKESQQQYLELSDTAWTKMFPEQSKPKPYKTLLAEIYLHFEEENSKSSLRQTSMYFAQNCLDDDEIMTQAIALLLKDGKPQKWIIHKVMNYANNQYNEGREKYYKLIGESDTGAD